VDLDVGVVLHSRSFYPCSKVVGVRSLRWRLPKVLFLINRYALPPLIMYATSLSILVFLPHKYYGLWADLSAWVRRSSFSHQYKSESVGSQYDLPSFPTGTALQYLNNSVC
jgi:hypothetical protein